MVYPVFKSVADQRHPITTKLTELFGGKLFERAKTRVKKAEGEGGPSPRVEIVSEKLIDDTIAYLAPTLEQHKGCTLVDIHPGACLFSSKLHDFLKPKRHVLMEPEERYYEAFIKPLLAQSGSTYRHTTMAGAHPVKYWQNYPILLDDPDFFPGHRALAPDDPRRRQFRSDILMIGNLARRYPIRRRTNSVHYSVMTMQHMAAAALTNDLIHRDGLVRTLWWVPESHASAVFPPTEAHRFASPLTLEMGSEVNLVVGTAGPWFSESLAISRLRRRPDVLDAVTRKRAQKSMAELGMRQPKDRPLLFQNEGVELDEEVVSPFDCLAKTPDELKKDIKDVADRLKKIRKTGLSGRIGGRALPPPIEQKLFDTIIFPQMRSIARGFGARRASPTGLATVADTVLRIIRLEASYKALEESGLDEASLKPFRNRILALSDEYEEFGAEKAGYKQWTNMIVDEQIAFFCKPPILALDGRKYEPLKAEETEVWPRSRKMMLLDQMPLTRDISVPDLAPAIDSANTAQMLIKHLMQARLKPLPAALETLAPNAAKDLIPQVPAISDPRKGGRMHLDSMRVRTMTAEMVEGLVKAWAEWPFKPTTIEMELALANLEPSGDGFEADAAEESLTEE